MKIVIIGGSGLIGNQLVHRLRERDHEVVAASPSTGVNAVTGKGLKEALAGAQVVVRTRHHSRIRRYWSSSRPRAGVSWPRKRPRA